MKTKNTLYVLSGPPRCGKSTWAREKASQLARRGIVCPIVSGDTIRRAVYQRRFWMPGEKLIRPYAWVMVRALFVAGHQNVIIDEANLDEEEINFWACNYIATTPSGGGRDYPPLLEVDKIKHKIAKSPRKVAEELQGDVIAWKRHVVVFRTSLRECERRAKKLHNYNQRDGLINHIRWLKKNHWNANFIDNYKLADGEKLQFVPERHNSELKVYLCGPIHGCTDEECKNWRDAAKAVLPDTLDPMRRDYRGLEDQNVAEIVEGDKADIEQCDALLVNYVKPSVGTSMEILYAWEKKKKIIVVARPEARISPWLRYHSTRIVNSFSAAFKILK